MALQTFFSPYPFLFTSFNKRFILSFSLLRPFSALANFFSLPFFFVTSSSSSNKSFISPFSLLHRLSPSMAFSIRGVRISCFHMVVFTIEVNVKKHFIIDFHFLKLLQWYSCYFVFYIMVFFVLVNQGFYLSN